MARRSAANLVPSSALALAWLLSVVTAGCAAGQAAGDPAGGAGGGGPSAGQGGSGGNGNPGTGTGGGAGPGAGGAGNPTGSGGAGTGAGGAGTGGASGTTDGGTPGTPGGMPALPGVLVTDTCVPLCANASTDPDGDGWGYERGASCIVPGSAPSRARLSCTTGAPLPPPGHPAGSAGVVSGGACVAFCTVLTVDDDNDGWGWEFEATCIFRTSVIGMTSSPCTTGGALDAGSNVGAAGRLLGDTCTRLCTTTVSDPDGDGYGFEFGASCLRPGSVPASRGIDCKVGVPEPTAPPVTLNPNPPRGQVTKPAGVASRGFFVANGRLYDKFGNDFVMRGLNSPHVWFDVGDQYLAYNALDNMAAFGANTIRVVWETVGGATLLRRVLRRVVEMKMIPMVELHDATGATANQRLLDMVAYYARADVKQVLLDYEEFLLVNVANEWSGTDFRGGYQPAVAALRAAGINHTLVIDANAYGQNAGVLASDAAALVTADPQHNLVFSVHMYEQYAAAAGGRTKITQTLEQAAARGVALVVGEFGPMAGAQRIAIDAGFIMSECVRLNLGYLAWSWKGNDTSLAYLDMAVDWEGATLTSWGGDVVRGTSGITATARKATIYTQ